MKVSKIAKLGYKMANRLKPLAARMLPASSRQKVKRLLLKKAFPLENKDSSLKKASTRRGINLVGYSRAEMGIGESCRIAARNLEAASIPFGILNFQGTNSARSSDESWKHKEVEAPAYDINVFHINAEQMFEVYSHYQNDIFQNKYNIGYWHWELPEFPERWIESFGLLDEIWVPSRFVADSIALKSPIPVIKIPHSIQVDITEERQRDYFQLPEDSFLFLTMYDMNSFQERKNPQASIRAFQAAFDPLDYKVGLVIKVNGYEGHEDQLEGLNKLVGLYKNIYFVRDTLSRNDTNSLLSVVDCYVSLHRSEGFGLGLAEAMFLGKPVIGTNWSSNTDFMSDKDSCLVDYQLIKLGRDYGPYEAFQSWADPKVEDAASYMRRLVEDKNYYDEIASNGMRRIREHYNPQAIGSLIQKRLDYIYLWKFGGKHENH